MKLNETIKKIEELVGLLEMFGSKRKPLVKRKIRFVDHVCIRVHICIGYDEVGMYTLNNLDEDKYFTDYETTTADIINMERIKFFMDVLKRGEDFRVMFDDVSHLNKLNRFKGMSKPSKKALSETYYQNKSFVYFQGEVLDMTSPENRHKYTGIDIEDFFLPRREDLMNQRIYIHGRDPVTNSMLMSRDYDIRPADLNRLIFEVISMNPHLVKDLHIDYYEFESATGNRYTGNLDVVAIATTSRTNKNNRYTGNLDVTAIAVTSRTKENTTQYYSIHEELHAKIVSSMPSSKDMNIAYSREVVTNEYMKAFLTMKDNMYSMGMPPSEIEMILAERKEGTAFLKVAVRGLLGDAIGMWAYQEASLFNHINHKLEIDAIKHNSNNRNMLSKALQDNLAWLEQHLLKVMTACKSVDRTKVLGILIAYIEEADLTNHTAPKHQEFVNSFLSQKDWTVKAEFLLSQNPYSKGALSATSLTTKTF